MLTKADGHLGFDRPARVVSAHARGVDPWPGASAMLDGAPLKLFTPRVVADGGVSAQGRPGEVLGLRPEGLAIACAERRDCVRGAAAARDGGACPPRRCSPGAAIPAGTVLA